MSTPSNALVSSVIQNGTVNAISISEIFGPTIQGEGALIGMPTVFIRTGGCDYRCHWCDTGYAVLPDYKEQWHYLSAQQILAQVNQLTQNKPMWITLSGGNPALQPLESLIEAGKAQGYQFSMETQGSIAQPWFASLDQMTLSPKPPSSGMHFKPKGLTRCIDACNQRVNLSLKFVISDLADLYWAKNIADQYPEIPCFIQPCNTEASLSNEGVNTIKRQLTLEKHQQWMQWLIDNTQQIHWYNVRILPQLHVWIWGDRSGV